MDGLLMYLDENVRGAWYEKQEEILQQMMDEEKLGKIEAQQMNEIAELAA